MFRALLDTCVLFKPLLCDLLLCLAEEGLFQPLWSADTGYESLVAVMENQANDRHVLAAAVRGQAELIVTENVRDFPATVTARYDIDVVDQDGFLLDQWDLDPVAVRRALTRQVSRYRREPRTVVDLLIALGRQAHGCPRFAAVCHGGEAGSPRSE